MIQNNKSFFWRSGLDLFLASLIVLFLELVLMRWLPGKVRALAYFPNLILISSFLGLGIGCLTKKSEIYKKYWGACLLLIVIMAEIGSRIAFTQNNSSEHLWLLYYDLPKNSLLINSVELPIILFFVLCAVPFIFLGEIIAEKFDDFKKLSLPLYGYCFDILGSLVGIILFTACSFYGSFPGVWFVIFLLFGTWFYRSSASHLISYLLISVCTVTLVSVFEKADYYSPYYAISIDWSLNKETRTFNILTNGSYHQTAHKLRDDSGKTATNSYSALVAEGYHAPYKMMGSKPKRGLIVGAGSGNDVSTMLEEGVSIIDAVEIDPKIIEMGIKYHPDNPYGSPKVNIINTDARAYLNTTKEKYDLIVFGTLDSMTRLSALSNVRLDNFVYTKESMQAAKKLLTPNGGLVLYFMVGVDYIHYKIMDILTASFGEAPIVMRQDDTPFNSIYLSGPLFSHIKYENRQKVFENIEPSNIPRFDSATDDWPFLYLKERGITEFYIIIISFILLLSIRQLYPLIRNKSGESFHWKTIDFQMFLFGASFLLLETSSVTVMNLFWGATWLTSAVVFASILLMVLLSTIVGIIKPIPFTVSFIGLIVSLITVYLVPISDFVQIDPFIKLIISILYVGTPIFFAGSCFAVIFAKRVNPHLAFGWNVLGAVFGGLLEFLSLIFGLKAMILIVVASYLCAYIIGVLKDRNGADLTMKSV